MFSAQRFASHLVKTIKGVTFIDVVALEKSIPSNTKVSDRLRQKMINAGVEFWDNEQRVVKKPVIGVSSIGGFLVSLENVPEDTIKLRAGDMTLGPLSIAQLRKSLEESMGSQAIHTYMNPKGKNADELYQTMVQYGHFSTAHAGYLGVTALGLSKKAELEFDVQRDVVHLARETSARSACQDDPTFVALTAEGAAITKEVYKSTSEILSKYKRLGDALDWREERNSLFPLAATVSLGINGSIRNFQKMMGSINDPGKEREYRNALALINDSLHGLLPELFKYSAECGHVYPAEWEKRPASPKASRSIVKLFDNSKAEPRRAILFLGAPGVGKSTQTARIVEQMPNVMCVSTGNLVRKLNKKVEDKLPLSDVEAYAAQSLERMKQGQLMDDAAVYALLMAYLSPGGEGYEAYSKAQAIILDGVIKEPANIKTFEKALDEFNRQSGKPMSLKQVVNIDTSDEELVNRQKARVTQAVLSGQPQRPDDNPETFKKRLREYRQNTQGILERYQSDNTFEFFTVDGSQQIEHTAAQLIAIIKNENKPSQDKLSYAK